MKITKSIIDQMTFEGDSAKQADIRWDDALTNFGVRVWPSGKKTFVIRYRLNGRRRYYTIGPYGPLTLQDARDIARRKLAEVIGGSDPLEERRKAARGSTFREFAELYIERHAKPKKKTWKEDEQKLKDYVTPVFGSRRISDIRRSDVALLHQQIGREYPVAANRTIECLSKLFDCAMKWGYLEESGTNPARGIDKFREVSRDRFVSHTEMPELAKAIEMQKSPYVRSAIWLYLLTGLRKRELLKLRWEDVNLATREIRIAKTKNGEFHYLPLSQPAVDLFQQIPKQLGNPHVFCGRRKGKPLDNIEKNWQAIRKTAGMEDVWLHDLRRTVGSWMAQKGASLPLIGRVLNHKSVSTTLIYSRFSQDPVREALDRHGAEIHSFFTPNAKPAPVAPVASEEVEAESASSQ